jgi:hypothetical protein
VVELGGEIGPVQVVDGGRDVWKVGGRKAGEQVREIDAAANIVVRHGTEAVGGGEG